MVSREMDAETKASLKDALNGNDGVFETVDNAIEWYFEHNPQDDPRTGEEFISWHLEIGEILNEDD